MIATQTISLLRFCIGSMHFGIAAEDVVAVAADRDSTVHIGAILGLASNTSDRRVIHLAAPPGIADGPPLVRFQADAPVDVVRLNADDILPIPAAVPPGRWKPVMGFARVSEHLVLLLDIPSVIAKLLEPRQGGVS